MPFKLPPSFGIGPTYNPVTEEWQKQKCQQLGISFRETFEQQPTLTGTLLSKIIPWQTEKLSMDGNCFFRCISKILSGTQDHHMKLRGEVSRYMVTNGRSIIKRYLKTFSKDASSVTYLKKSGMTESGVWGTDIEIVAISCILDLMCILLQNSMMLKNFGHEPSGIVIQGVSIILVNLLKWLSTYQIGITIIMNLLLGL